MANNSERFTIVILSSGKSAWALDGMFWSLANMWPELFHYGNMNYDGISHVPHIVIATDNEQSVRQLSRPGSSDWIFEHGIYGEADGPVYYSGAINSPLIEIWECGKDVPFEQWNSGFFIPMLEQLNEEGNGRAIILLDDYWLTRPVDPQVVLLYEQMNEHRILKIDLAADVLYSDFGHYSGNNNTYSTAGHFDLIERKKDLPYYFLLWGGLWNVDRLLELSRVFASQGWESPHALEISGTPTARAYWDDTIVLGTRQAPLVHANIISGGKLFDHGNGPRVPDKILIDMQKDGVLMRP